MQSSNKNKIIVIIVSIIIVISIIIGIVLYFATDIFKTDEEMFQKYMLQDINFIDGIVDLSQEIEYRKILDNNFDENSTINLNYTNSEGNQDIFTGNIVGVNNKEKNTSYKDMKINSGDINVAEIEYLKENQIYGLHFVGIADKFATVDTSNNISTIIKYFGLENIFNADKINPINISEFFDITDEEKEQLISKYLSLVLQYVNKNNYSSEKENMITLSNGTSINTDSYILTINSEQLKKICMNILSELKQDDIILGKLENTDNQLKEMGINLTQDLKTQFINIIDNKLNNVNIENELTITIYENEGYVLRTVIKYGSKTIQLDYNDLDLKNVVIKYLNEIGEKIEEIILSINKQENTIDITYEDNSNRKFELTRSIEMNSNNVKSSLDFRYSNEKEIKNLQINLNRNINLGTNNEIPTSFDKVGKILLNDYDEKATNYAFTTLKNRIIKAVREKRDQTNSVLLNYIIEYNNQLEEESKQDIINERKQFNSKFELYEGQNVEQSIVLNMLDEAGKNMSNYQVIGNNKIKLYIEKGKQNEALAAEIKEEILNLQVNGYNITMGYDDNDRISEITIELMREETQQ